jgi:hypothetical protein
MPGGGGGGGFGRARWPRWFKSQWSGDHLDFGESLLGQRTIGRVDVAEDHVRLVQLFWRLSLLANKTKALVEKQGKLLLKKPVKPTPTRN